MEKKRFAKIFFALIFLFSINTASAQESPAEFFYFGNITIESIVANVNIDRSNTALLNIEYALKNSANSEESIQLGFALSEATLKVNGNAFSNPVRFKPNEEKILSVDYGLAIEGDVTKTFALNPAALTFNSNPNAKRIKNFFAQIFLPEGVKKIIWSNKEPYSSGLNENGLAYYTWQQTDSYSTMLSIKYSTLDIDLVVVKNVSPAAITDVNQKITIELTVENRGGRGLSNIALMDDYSPGEFEAASPPGEFAIPDQNESDPRLWWIKRIDSLAAGEKKTFSYSLKYIGDVYRIYSMLLGECVATVDGHLAAVSNEPKIAKMTGIKNLAQEKPPKPQTPHAFESQLIVFSVIAVTIILIAAFGFLKFARKK